ncbi:MAG: ceramidase domain-containing protein [Pseudomonadota bacterium]
MSLFDPVDIYCERTDPSYWSEPVNALTNLAFIAAGLYGLHLARHAGTDLWPKVLCIWVMAIGLGSYLFHTHAQPWAGLADVIPIWTFFLAYVAFALRRYLKLSWAGVGIGFLIGIALIFGTTALIPEAAYAATNGSIQYLPAIIALIVFSFVLWRAGSGAAHYVLLATGIFAISITFRSIDMAVCGAFPLGTHFLWHILNGLMLAILLVASVREGPQPVFRAAR